LKVRVNNTKEKYRRRKILRRLASKYGDIKIEFRDASWFESVSVKDCISCAGVRDKKIYFNKNLETSASLSYLKRSLLHEIGHIKRDKTFTICVVGEVEAERFAYEEIKKMKDVKLYCETVYCLQDFKKSSFEAHRKAYKRISKFPEKYAFSAD
jgi:hypothetical protein